MGEFPKDEELSMPAGRGLIRGFIVGVVVTLVAVGGIGYSVYKRIEKSVSPETVRETTEEALARILGGEVHVQSGEVILPNLLTLTGVELSDSRGEIVSVDRVELIAEGGVQGLKKGQFGQIRLVHPRITLERDDQKWNLVEFLKPLLSRSITVASASTPSASTAHPGLPLRLVDIVDLDFRVSLKNREIYSGISVEQLALSRNTLDSPWDVHCKKGRLRLNPSAEEWPLVETYAALANLVRSGTASRKAPPSGTPSTGMGPAAQISPPSWLGECVLDDFDLEFIHPNQHLTVSGLSLQAGQMLEFIRLQTGDLKKKTPSPKA